MIIVHCASHIGNLVIQFKRTVNARLTVTNNLGNKEFFPVFL